jgi:hypothetical protein
LSSGRVLSIFSPSATSWARRASGSNRVGES